MPEHEVIGQLRSGMTIGIGGWGSQRKPMSLVREILRSDIDDLTVVSYGGADVGLLCAAGKVKKVVHGLVSMDSVPPDPHFLAAQRHGRIQVEEYDEGMFQWGLYAAGNRLPYLPTPARQGPNVLHSNPELRTVIDPYGGELLVAMPALPLDVALVHMNRADVHGNAQHLGPNLYFDDLFCGAAEQAFVSCERIVPTAELTAEARAMTIRIPHLLVSGVVPAPGGAHFTSCVPDYERDEGFQREYLSAAQNPQKWRRFTNCYLSGPEADYQRAVKFGVEGVPA